MWRKVDGGRDVALVERHERVWGGRADTPADSGALYAAMRFTFRVRYARVHTIPRCMCGILKNFVFMLKKARYKQLVRSCPRDLSRDVTARNSNDRSDG